MKKTLWWTGLLFGSLSAGCGAVQDVSVTHGASADHATGVAADDEGDDGDDEADEQEEDVALDQLPAAVKTAAQNEVPGLVLTRAEKETEDGSLHYCVHGTVNGEAVEVEVTPEGKVLEVEHGEDEDDD